MTDRRQQLSLLMGILVGIVLFLWAIQSLADVNLDAAGMGRNTVPRTGYSEGLQISSVGDPPATFPAWDRFVSKGAKVGLWLGASQIYCINNTQPQDRLAVEYVNQLAIDKGFPLGLVQVTAPNANLYELLAFYLAFRQKGRIPDWLVIGLVYDDLREETIRETFLRSLGPLGSEILEQNLPGARYLEDRRIAGETAEENQGPVARNATSDTPQEQLEKVLVEVLESQVPGYKDRHKLTGQFKITVRASLSKMFGSVSQRRASAIPEARKQWNHQAFLALLTIASQDGCQILVYKPPHRPSEGPFYHDREAYDAYFEGVGQMLESMPQTHFLDLERLVPAEFWGVTNWGRPDVFHFTVEGHKRLAGAIETFFREQLTGAANAVQ